jgi:hypothetical protein
MSGNSLRQHDERYKYIQLEITHDIDVTEILLRPLVPLPTFPRPQSTVSQRSFSLLRTRDSHANIAAWHDEPDDIIFNFP